MKQLCLSFLLILSWLPSALAESPLLAEAKLTPYEIDSEQVAKLEIQLHLPTGYKAYQDQFKIHIIEPEGTKLSAFQISPLKEVFDKFSKKKKNVVIDSALLTAPLEIPILNNRGEQTMKVQLTYQACTESYCLFPETLTLDARFLLKAPAGNHEERGFLSLSFKDAYGKGLAWAFVFVFVFGLLTSLTPCVYPMIPITIAVLGREAHTRTRWQNFLVSWVYVTGIGITFSLLGVFAASTGVLFGSFMSSPWVLGIVCLVFLTMALSMFGLFELEAPRFLRDGVLSHTKWRGYGGALITGMLAGVVSSPCVGPVLVGVLTFVAQTKNLWLGFWLLFTYAFGMGMLFLALGISTSFTRLLPKSGLWMIRIKMFFGLLLIGAALYYLDILLVSSKVTTQSALTTIKQWASENADKKFAKQGFRVDTMNWLLYSEELLKKAQAEHKPVIIDFRADWCAACLEMEEKTFVDQGLQLLSSQFVMVRFDATQDSDLLKELRQKYKIVGLPTVLFINEQGQVLTHLTLTEFEAPSPFMERMKKTLKPKF